jgi:phenylacetate-CoA ligase
MKLQRLYHAAPVGLQNLLVSAYGYYQRHKRYGGNYAALYAQVLEVASATPARIAELQGTKLVAMWRHCCARVPYYRQLLAQLNLGPESIRAVEDLRRLPILGKETLRSRSGEFAADGERPFWMNHTSGSTGTSLTVGLDATTYRLTMAMLAEHEARLGILPGAARATFAGRAVQPPDDPRPPYWRHNRADNQTLFSTLHISDATVPAYIEQLENVQPDEIIGYPSAIYAIAEFCLRHDIRPRISPKAVVTNSETLFDWQRGPIERAFGCRVADYYGTAEGIVFASQCIAGRYHFNPLLAIVEVLDARGEPARSDEPGRLVCTTLTNTVMPLMRYEIGDDASPAKGACPCGSAHPAVASIVGRTDDAVITPEGRTVGRLDHIFKGLDGVRECQIVQDRIDHITLNVVADGSFGSQGRRLLADNLRERVGSGVQIDIVNVESIPRTTRGKFKGVISLVQSTPQNASARQEQLTPAARTAAGKSRPGEGG